MKIEKKKITPDSLTNQKIKDYLEEIRKGVIRIILTYKEESNNEQICSYIDTYLYDWVLGIGVDMVLTAGDSWHHLEKDEFEVAILIDERELLCLREKNWEGNQINYSYKIGPAELREYKLQEVLN